MQLGSGLSTHLIDVVIPLVRLEDVRVMSSTYPVDVFLLARPDDILILHLGRMI